MSVGGGEEVWEKNGEASKRDCPACGTSMFCCLRRNPLGGQDFFEYRCPDCGYMEIS